MDELWDRLAERAGGSLNEDQHAALGRYLDLLLTGNKRLNLTRITDVAQARLLHIADSLTLLAHLPAGAINVADVGSGGGVPGIPLAIARPEIRVTLIESAAKKCVFLRETVEALALNNVTILPGRVEEAGRGKARETFDVAIVRAVAEMVWLVEWCLPLVRVGGRMLAMKGPRGLGELENVRPLLRLLGGGQVRVIPAELPGAEGHVIIEIAKARPSREAYPRHPTHAKNKPLQPRL